MTPELELDAWITSYIYHLRLDLTAEQVWNKFRDRFGAQPTWSVERITELLNVRKAARAPKAPTAHMVKVADSEVKNFIRSFAASGQPGRVVREAVASRFGNDRTPSLTTVTHTLAETRRAAGLLPKRQRAGSRRRGRTG